MAAIEESLMLRVAAVESLTPVIKQFRLVAANQSARLPGYDAGAHIHVEVNPEGGVPQWRRYSLVSFSRDRTELENPAEYVVAVRLEVRGRGGSKFLHENVQAGDLLRALPPRNDFQLASNGAPVLAIAGGIGVTPLATMVATLRSRDQPVTMFFAGRDRDSLAYIEPLRSMLGTGLRLHVDQDAGGPPDMTRIVAEAAQDADVYVCGPQPMLDAVLAAVRSRDWPQARVHFEMFSAPVGALPNRAFDVVLARSGRELRVNADQTLLHALKQAGCDVLYDCERGECGVCTIPVLDGLVDHRDYVLTEREKAEGRCMHACVSRAAGERLVLDL